MSSHVWAHSCKATALPWLSKTGVDLPTRKLLGCHAEAEEHTPLVYARDAVSACACACVSSCPNASRSCYLPRKVNPPPAAPEDEECSGSKDSANEDDNQDDLDIVRRAGCCR